VKPCIFFVACVALVVSTSSEGYGAVPHVHERAHDTWDGWLVYYQDDGKTRIPTGPTLTTEWVVPPKPTLVAGQDIAFFNGIQTSAGTGEILQPVLDFGQDPRGSWIITSEHYSGPGHDVQSEPIEVSPGDVIRGVVSGSSCQSNGACAEWDIATTDLTTGQSTSLRVKSPGVPDKVNPGVLETYGVLSCEMLPPSGEETFRGNELQDAYGRPQQLDYELHVLTDGPAAGLPSCGYRGTSGSNAYRLIFETAAVDAEPNFDGPDGCQCVVVGSAVPGDGQVPAVVLVLLSLLAIRRVVGTA
jgi:hypothetical protein